MEGSESNRSVTSLTESEAEALFKIALWKEKTKTIALKIEKDEVRVGVQLSDGDYLFRIHQDGSLLARMNYQDGAGYQINALGIILYLESIGITLDESL
jgi:hypothetical protein